MRQIKSLKWKAACGACIGVKHAEDSTPCQDVVHTRRNKNCVAITLSDGLGSRHLSHIGAAYITSNVAKLLVDNFDLYYTMDKSEIVTIIIESVVEILKSKVACSGTDIEDYAATLLAVAVENDRYIAIHLGDGAIGCMIAGAIEVISSPENEEYANCVTPITSISAKYETKIFKGCDQLIEGFIIMSDGVTSCMYDKATNTMAPSSQKLLNYLELNSEVATQKKILSIIDEFVKKHTFDDCSIAILRKKTLRIA